MFDTLGNRLTTVIQRLGGRKTLDEDTITQALRDIRVALLEADVALTVARDFLASVKDKLLVNNAALKPNETVGERAVLVVFEEMRRLLGSDTPDDFNLNFAKPCPAVFLMVGLQGAGKTTSAGKLAHWLHSRHKQKVLLASLDLRRPAAREQLAILAQQAGVESLPIENDTDVAALTARALSAAAHGDYNVVILDTAGRTVMNAELMDEVAQVHAMAQPRETLLALDALSGQDALQVAKNFHDRLGLSGVILTRVDSDARGGAALSVRAATGCPIKFVGMGEKIDALEAFDPVRAADRILGMGDLQALAEKAAGAIDEEVAQNMMQRLMSGKFDLNDQLQQMRQMHKLGGMGSLMSLLPGMRQMKEKLAEADPDGSMMRRQEAIILSMTPKERKNPALINASRLKRIAAGSGVQVADVNKLLQAHEQTAGMLRQMTNMDMKGMAAQMQQKGINPEDVMRKMQMNGGELPPELANMFGNMGQKPSGAIPKGGFLPWRRR